MCKLDHLTETCSIRLHQRQQCQKPPHGTLPQVCGCSFKYTIDDNSSHDRRFKGLKKKHASFFKIRIQKAQTQNR